MKLSALVLAVSACLSAIAHTLHTKVVTPAMRTAYKTKELGLERAFQELDVAYWNSVDDTQYIKTLALEAANKVKAVEALRTAAHRATVLHAKVKAA